MSRSPDFDDGTVVVCRAVGKRFHSFEHRPTSLRELFIHTLGRKQVEKPPADFALSDISFEVQSGEVLALIGDNGSGKSTVLRLLAGIYRPTEGFIRTVGRVATVIELGAGLHPELTGVENAWLYASVLGLSDSEIRQRLPKMLSFAAIGDAVWMPVKYYSSGMLARLAFAVAMSVRPDIFLVDEVLAVGDQTFRERCVELMTRYIEGGLTLIVVSHELELVRSLCTRAIWLDGGTIRMQGEAETVVSAYEEWNHQKTLSAASSQDSSAQDA